MLFSCCGLIPATLTFSDYLLMLPLMVLGALLLDKLVGEPRRFHPLVGFGIWAGWLEKHFNRPASSHFYTRLSGQLALMLALSPLLLVLGLVWCSSAYLWLWMAVQVVILYVCIGWKSLQQHVIVIADAPDTETARRRLSFIVSRGTDALDPDEVAQAACESLLENSADALFVSLFWFALGGAPLALLHRWSNTLDAMWGYRNERFIHFGRAAARFDDLLAYWPARITALLFILVSGRNIRRAWHCWRTQARHCSSPNGGVVMTSGAGALNIRLSSRACYHGEWHRKPVMGCGDPAVHRDIKRAVSLVNKSLALLMVMWLLAAAVLYFFYTGGGQ